MDLRPELLPPPVDKRRLDEMCTEIERIGDLISRGETVAGSAVAAFKERTGHDYTFADFVDYYGWRSLEEFAAEAARPAWPSVPDITREELVEIVSRILAEDPEAEYYLRLLRANVSHPEVYGLIFRPSPELEGASPEEIVEAALSYRPVAL
jgi:hypothetical protein